MNRHPPLPYSPDVEEIPPDEPRDIQEILDVMRDLFRRDKENSGEARRDVHVKSHGCPTGMLEVRPGLPAELRQGLFEHDRTYPVSVRFSNSSPQPQPDAVPDGRGIAIKVREVTGSLIGEGATDPGSQDFVMVNSPTFVARNVKDYLGIERTRLEGLRRPQVPTKAFTGGNWDPRRWHWNAALAAAGVLARFSTHPVHQTYYSMTPFRFGDYVAKYRLKPISTVPLPSRIKLFLRHQDAFRLTLEEVLRKRSVAFEFEVQLRTDASKMPIEDATVLWPETESPYRPIARLVIPQQVTDASAIERGDALAFNVWNALESHRPLGGINRSRLAAYRLSTSWRQKNTLE